MTDGLLLIGGSPRSGTTALLHLLNSNPHVFISSEENLFKSLKALDGLLDTRDWRIRKMDGQMRETSPRETLAIDNVHRYNMDGTAVWPTLRFIFEYHHRQVHPKYRLKIWGDKLPTYAQEIPKVLSLPGASYIHITRNPYDVVNSMLRRTEAARRGEDWWTAITDFDEMIEAWSQCYLAIEQYENQSSVLHLHYEQLVFDFQQSCLRICRFLQSDLLFENVLVDDPGLHYDRSNLTEEMMKRIYDSPVVKAYTNRYLDNADTPHVATALHSAT